MKKYLPLVLLALITVLGLVIRFYKLGIAPAGLYLDEAGQGYSAYSILKTGKDEFGKAFPVAFRNFNDFKTPVYIYLIVPLIPIFGLTPFTVRFPSFIFSILTFPLLYFFINQLLENNTPKPPLKLRGGRGSYGLIATLLLAISPWHTLFGRTNFECNVALFLMLAGFYLFYLGLKKPIMITFAGLVLALALPAYHSQRLLVPLISIILFIRHRKILLSKKHLPFLTAGAIIAAVITIPTALVATTPGFLARASGLNIFSHTRQLPAGILEWYQGPLQSIINSSWYLSTKEFLSLYFSYFSPRQMFFLGDYGPRSSFPDLSTFFVWQFPLYLYGLYLFVTDKSLKELRFFFLTLLLVAPIPAAVTRDPYTTIRALPMVIPLSILMALAAVKLIASRRKLALVILLWLTIYSALKLYSSAIILNEHFRAPYWNYGWHRVVDRLNSLDQSLPVIVDNARNEPYIQLLFYLKHDPTIYQKENFEVALSEYYTNMSRNTTKKIGRITTRSIEWVKDTQVEQYLVGDYLAISEDQIRNNNLTLIEEIRFPDMSTAFRIVKTNPNTKK